jgi:hypothetical protein
MNQFEIVLADEIPKSGQSGMGLERLFAPPRIDEHTPGSDSRRTFINPHNPPQNRL